MKWEREWILLATTINNQLIHCQTDTCKVDDFLTEDQLFHPCKHGQTNGYFSIPIHHLTLMEYCNIAVTKCCTSANITRGQCMVMPWSIQLLRVFILIVYIYEGENHRDILLPKFWFITYQPYAV